MDLIRLRACFPALSPLSEAEGLAEEEGPPDAADDPRLAGGAALPPLLFPALPPWKEDAAVSGARLT